MNLYILHNMNQKSRCKATQFNSFQIFGVFRVLPWTDEIALSVFTKQPNNQAAWQTIGQAAWQTIGQAVGQASKMEAALGANDCNLH